MYLITGGPERNRGSHFDSLEDEVLLSQVAEGEELPVWRKTKEPVSCAEISQGFAIFRAQIPMSFPFPGDADDSESDSYDAKYYWPRLTLF